METVWKSVEIRWFFREAPSWLLHLFKAWPEGAYSEETREDLYLETGEDSIGIKLRHNQLEIKTRIGTPEFLQISGVSGVLEHWEKRGFPIRGDWNPGNRTEGWITVRKTRKATLCRPVSEGIECEPLAAGMPPSCQVEHTVVTIEGVSWHSFGLEWPEGGIPGYENHTDWLPGILEHMGVSGLGDPTISDLQEAGLSEGNSMGYPAFLNRRIVR